ncbi:IQ and AAA domain-containing protein 1-like isoform X2 [Hyposmocoma kahamanoa]|uniref:IQ and AAA domain-containing protein 1-like isoform X2 n=1 Tax=Hyposmocoma kahamanoa TaxID=1477025 RepID=UPI000E6D7151|nr:IQ and AAA domain-containing protein 1-like isoform X2 [Hyposmocoma kahamanoa]
MRILEDAQKIVTEDVNVQKRAAKGVRIPSRKLPLDMLGRTYAQYCNLINKIYESYVNAMQLQRNEYMLEIVAIILKRMYELRNEIVHYVVNDYIFVDDALIQMHMTPYDIEIVVPYHLPLEARPASKEHLLQKMWLSATRRKAKAGKPKKQKKAPSKPVILDDNDDGPLDGVQPDTKTADEQEGQVKDEVEEEESESEDDDAYTYSDHTVIPQEFTFALLIQRHERYRQFYLVYYLEKVANYRQFFKPAFTPPSEELKEMAAALIQKMYRKFMCIKRENAKQHKRDILLGMIPDVDRRPLVYAKETELLNQRHYKEKEHVKEYLRQKSEKTNKRLLWLRKGELIEDITEEIVEWFKEWYYGYGFFPLYPYELEGGTVIVVKGEYPSIEEQQLEDERYAKNTKGKTKEQLKQDREKAREEEKMKAEQMKEMLKKEKANLVKARCNPSTDPGYDMKISEYQDELCNALRRYRQAWTLIDTLPPERWGDAIYGFMAPILSEELMEKIQLEARVYVDEMMRLELKTFTKAQKAMYSRLGWRWPKRRPRKRPKPPPLPPDPFIVDNTLLKSIEPIFDLNIMSRPTTKICDIVGDYSFIAYSANVQDPDAKYPSPGYGDIRRRLLLSCVFASGLEQPPPKRNKAVLLLGIPRNGKSFMVDAIAGEMNAVKFDISPDVFSAKIKKVPKYLNLVFQAARVFQPSVIFCKNIERVFYKKVPPAEKKEKAKSLKKPLQKLLKSIPVDEKIIFIATCSNPWVAKARGMIKTFDETILVPWPDYGSIQQFFYWAFQKIRSMPRDFCTQALAQIFKGLGMGAIMDVFHSVLNSERICKLNVTRLDQSEFVEYMIENEIEQLSIFDLEKYTDFALRYSPLKAERAEYEMINTTRAEAYAALRKKAEEAAQKAAKKG